MTLAVDCRIERWPLLEPFVIARDVMRDVPVLYVSVTDRAGHRGQAEAAGVDYDGETPERMAAAVAAVAPRLTDGVTGEVLNAWLPPGGARNALDCALWDLAAKQSGRPVWQLAGLPEPGPVATAFTLGLSTPEAAAVKAAAARAWPLIKVKVDAREPVAVVRAVRLARPDARIIVDANESWTLDALDRHAGAMASLGVEMIEQPLARGQDAELGGRVWPLPIVADESCTDAASLAPLAGRYQGVNIKLDKCGGLTEALRLANAARRAGLDVMVGNMCGTSLAMAPALVVAQGARWADLDGPLLQTRDREPAMRYAGGRAYPAEPALWG